MILLNKSRKSAVLLLNNYKTFKFYGKKTIDVECTLAAPLIKHYAVIKEYSPERWLLVRKRNKAADGAYEKAARNDCTKVLLQTFKRTGKRVSCSMIGRSIVSDACSMRQVKQLGEEMPHSAGAAMGVGKTGISCRTSFRFVAHNQNCFRGVSFCAGVLALLRPISPRLQHPPQTAAASSAEQYCP